MALGAVELALGSVLAAHWADELLSRRVPLPQVISSFALFVVLAELVALGPLLFFFGQLVRTRQRGLHSYGEFALRYTRAFHAKWIEPGTDCRPPSERTAQASSERPPELLGSSDISSLGDLANAFEVIRGMRLVPFGRRPVTLLIVGALLPMLPLIVLEKSLTDLVLSVGRIFLGAP